MASIWDQLEAEARGGPRLVPTPANPVSRAVRSAISRVSDAVAASPAGAQQIENSLLDVGELLSGLFAPGGAKGAGLVLNARNVPKLRAAMDAYFTRNPKLSRSDPSNVAMAFVRAKYPKLTDIPDYMRSHTSNRVPARENSVIMGEYLAEPNIAKIYTGYERKSEEFVDTMMHETMHARQAYRVKPRQKTNPETGEISIHPDDLRRAKIWDRNYAIYDAFGQMKARDAYNKAISEGTPKDEALRIWRTVRDNAYRFDNPYEVAAFKAGDTAENTYKMFQRFDTISRPGQRSRILDRVRDWMDQFLGGR